jgi:hypothetical protein
MTTERYYQFPFSLITGWERVRGADCAGELSDYVTIADGAQKKIGNFVPVLDKLERYI